MQEKEFLDLFRPYEKGHAFGYTDKVPNQYFIKMEIVERKVRSPLTGNPIIKPYVYFAKDFFQFGDLIDPVECNAEIVNGKIVCNYIPYKRRIMIEPIPEEPYESTVEWKDELGYFNLLNPELHEAGLIRKIGNITYYPLNLFKFKNATEVAKTFHMNDLRCLCGWTTINNGREVKLHVPTSTLYYYIVDDVLYIGRWEYKRFMPLDPVRLKVVGLEDFLKSPDEYMRKLKKYHATKTGKIGIA